jgi:septal ring factor EnvC (AmiA/AmiB activator)
MSDILGDTMISLGTAVGAASGVISLGIAWYKTSFIPQLVKDVTELSIKARDIEKLKDSDSKQESRLVKLETESSAITASLSELKTDIKKISDTLNHLAIAMVKGKGD